MVASSWRHNDAKRKRVIMRQKEATVGLDNERLRSEIMAFLGHVYIFFKKRFIPG